MKEKELIQILQNIDFTEETNDSWWNAINDIIRLIDNDENNLIF